jgi:tetratricopeptide (TPR) repeat protein
VADDIDPGDMLCVGMAAFRPGARVIGSWLDFVDANLVVVYARRMPNTADYQPWHRYKDAMTASARLSHDDGDKALRLLDDAIALAINENDNRWVVALHHHAAVISTFLGKTELVKHYYQKSLDFSPENPRALYGLAKAAKNQGDLELAKEYAARCHKALMEGDDFLRDARLETLETLLKDWPLPD